MSNNKNETSKQLKDIIHDDPWTLEEYDQNQQTLECVACENAIVYGTYYTCPSLSSSNKALHKCCGDLPLEFQNHPLHPQHILHIEKVTYDNHSDPYCFACLWPCDNKYSYVCNVKKCNSFFDVGCVTLKDRKIKLKCHHHPLVFHKLQEELTCNACGKRHIGRFYQCLECVQFWINEYCGSQMKESIKYEYHEHELKLYYTYPKNLDRTWSMCKVCEGDFYTPCWIYCCKGCRFFIHASCGIHSRWEKYKPNPDGLKGKIKTIGDLVFAGKHKLGLKDSIDPNAINFPICKNEYATLKLINDFLVAKQKKDKGKEKEEEEKIEHFSHPNHNLLLHQTLDSKSIRKLSPPNKCGGCLRPIETPFFSCSECNFFLHKCCAQLPRSIDHPSHHNHQLVLCERPLEIFKAFECNICNEFCNGIIYQCKKKSCHFNIDVECAFLPKTIIHEAVPRRIEDNQILKKIILHENHPHQLVLRYSTRLDKCDCCGSDLNTFGYICEMGLCGFTLSPKCVLVPREVQMPRFDKHALKLTYKPLPSQQEEGYCDICENYLDPLKWFYSCVECDRFMHTKCIFSIDMLYPKLKDFNFEKTYYVDSHSHPLTLDFSGKGHCDHCGNDAEYSQKLEDNFYWVGYNCDKDIYFIQAKCAMKYNLLKEKPG